MLFVKQIKWGFEFAAYRSIEFLLRQLSIPQAHALGSTLGGFSYHFLASRRQVVRRNLRIALGDCLSLDEIQNLTRAVFAHTGANLVCSLRTPGISSEELEEVLEIRNLDTLRDLIARGKGVILLSPHMGNWELLAQLIHWLPEDAELGTHYRPLNNPRVNALVERQRSERGTRLFAKKESPHAMAGFLRNGGTLGILADQRAGRIGHCCEYYGRLSSCSPLPEILSRRTGAAVVSISLASLAPGKWRCTFRHVTDSSTPGCMSALEEATRPSPGDVFWFQDRWRISASTPFELPGKLYKGIDPAATNKPIRFLMWMESADAPLPDIPAGHRAPLQLEAACPEGQAPPSFPDLPWSRTWATDPSLQPEQLERFFGTIDESDPLPLDGIIMTREIPAVRRAARRAGVGCYLVSPLAP